MAGRAVPRHRRLPSGADAPPLAGCGGESQSLAASLRAPAEAAETAEKVTEEKSDGRSYDRAPTWHGSEHWIGRPRGRTIQCPSCLCPACVCVHV